MFLVCGLKIKKHIIVAVCHERPYCSVATNAPICSYVHSSLATGSVVLRSCRTSAPRSCYYTWSFASRSAKIWVSSSTILPSEPWVAPTALAYQQWWAYRPQTGSPKNLPCLKLLFVSNKNSNSYTLGSETSFSTFIYSNCGGNADLKILSAR